MSTKSRQSALFNKVIKFNSVQLARIPILVKRSTTASVILLINIYYDINVMTVLCGVMAKRVDWMVKKCTHTYGNKCPKRMTVFIFSSVCYYEKLQIKCVLSFMKISNIKYNHFCVKM